ncbi:Protein of unknown function DUF3455 [Penicillium alfredii]|uniref:Malate dehydrogenase n=1 Tax=Penicillium alfredii TaxID=1506179 RepID=A0A9W9F0M2_9EURO|nr:Protein of unknown function DUF3455 [Penicillium alfredii]KAJ5091415.1 Protein of unknown function DUF3455 [Penicillium alfredii]
MHSIPFLLLCLAAVSLAAPTGLFDDAYNYSGDLAKFYGKVSQYIHGSKNNGLFSTCDTSKIALPGFASNLTSPGDLKPMYVGVGRGTQNYTCADSTAKSEPKAAGAVANLYNATCIAASYPALMEIIPKIAYAIPLPQNEDSLFPPANMELMGHHFFYDSSTPEFNLDLSSKKNGIVMTKKKGELNAPKDAFKGKDGAVSWLYLTATDGTVGDYKSVYRVNTAGGSPPKTCQGLESSFTVQYAANYYFFGK